MSSIKQPSRRIRRAVLVAIAALAGSFAAAAPSHAAYEPVYEFQPIQLAAYDIEDWWPDTRDELRLTIGGTVWNGAMSGYTTVPGSSLPRVRFRGSSICITLYERDEFEGSSDDRLGGKCVGPNDTGIRFYLADKWDYVLSFRIVLLGYEYVPDPLTVSLDCDSAGSYTIICDQAASGGTAPYTVKWYLNGSYLGANDNRTQLMSACRPDQTNSVRVVVADAAGVVREEMSQVHCTGYAE